MKFDDTIDLLNFFKLLSPYYNESLIDKSIYVKDFKNNNINTKSLNSDVNFHKIDIEAVLSNATRISFVKEKIMKIQSSFESKNDIKLVDLNIKYSLNKMNYDYNSNKSMNEYILKERTEYDNELINFLNYNPEYINQSKEYVRNNSQVNKHLSKSSHISFKTHDINVTSNEELKELKNLLEKAKRKRSNRRIN